jgi:hypothetical protein
LCTLLIVIRRDNGKAIIIALPLSLLITIRRVHKTYIKFCFIYGTTLRVRPASNLGSILGEDRGTFLFASQPKPALGPNCFPVLLVTRAVSMGLSGHLMKLAALLRLMPRLRKNGAKSPLPNVPLCYEEEKLCFYRFI